jgi:putative endonuclease
MVGGLPKHFVYMVISDSGTVYTGGVQDLHLPVYLHRTKKDAWKRSRKKLVYYEVFASQRDANNRRKEIKGWTRKNKLELITSVNPNLSDLEE